MNDEKLQAKVREILPECVSDNAKAVGWGPDINSQKIADQLFARCKLFMYPRDQIEMCIEGLDDTGRWSPVPPMKRNPFL